MSNVINYENAQTQEAAAQAQRARDEQNAKAWHAILDKYPLRDTQANYSIVLGWSNPITLESFEALLRSKSNSLDMSSREKIIEDIIAHSVGDTNTLRNLRTRLSTYSLAQLRQKRRDIDFKAEVHTKDAAKKFVSSQRDKEIGWKGTGYPRLQNSLVPPGQVQAVPTGDFLRKIAKSDLWLFKRYVKLYSSAQIDYWLQN